MNISFDKRKNIYKSKAERRIADFLEINGIVFTYEKPTAVIDSGKTRIWYPDFTLSSGIVIEYIGITNNTDYAKSSIHKLKVYKDNLIPVIALKPKDINRWWKSNLLEKIHEMLKNNINHIASIVRFK